MQSTDRLSPANAVAVGSCRLSVVGVVREDGVVEVGRVRSRGVKSAFVEACSGRSPWCRGRCGAQMLVFC